jgi:hypothetical protein
LLFVLGTTDQTIELRSSQATARVNGNVMAR